MKCENVDQYLSWFNSFVDVKVQSTQCEKNRSDFPIIKQFLRFKNGGLRNDIRIMTALIHDHIREENLVK